VTPTFADSFYFLALFNPRDAAHGRAVSASRNIRGTLITTEWVLTEVADALCDPRNRAQCVALIDDVRRSSRIQVEPASRKLFEDGWNLYRERTDKDWSLTDCTSFELMQERTLTDALTGDHHFEQAGFRALLK
jgi:predicted nucleic acid-binding protein